jgi:RND family efflux transporter MFP subunit
MVEADEQHGERRGLPLGGLLLEYSSIMRFAGLAVPVAAPVALAAALVAILGAAAGCSRTPAGGESGVTGDARRPDGQSAGHSFNSATIPPPAPGAAAGGAGVPGAPAAPRSLGAAGGPVAGVAGGPVAGAAGNGGPPSRAVGYVGVVLARQAVTVSAEGDGRLASVSVRVGDAVRRGQELAVLATDAMRDEMVVVQATVAAARSEERRAELELDRTRDRRARRELHPELYAEEDLASARNAEQAAAAAVDSAKARVGEEMGRLRQLETRLQHAVLRSPIDGRVALRYLDAGALVHSGAPVVRLISAGEFMLRFAVPPEQAAAIRKGAGVEMRLDSLPLILSGRVSQVAPRLDTASQMVFVEADLQVPPAILDRLQDGLPGRVSLRGSAPRS